MGQNEIHVESYDEITSSANDMLSTMRTLNDDVEYIDKYVKDVFSDNSFQGRASEYLDDVWSSINNNAISGISKLSENAAILDKMNHNYADADKKSSNGIEGIQ